MSIAERYASLRAQVPAHVTIVAVSKFQPVEAVREAIAAGVTDVGENYVQEASGKLAGLNVRKHFIGHVQTNKAKGIAATFDMVQSVDRIEAGTALAKAAAALGKRLPVLLQLNVSPTERFGCQPADAPRLAEQLRALDALEVQGVMAIGPITEDRAALARAFEAAAQVCARIGGSTLSIGMSGDWREAVAAGSTMIRVGTTIFGPRPAPRASK
ncbi:MAG TPA: YggS family pyridoxal phosphate-dependent enzyme [Candidatus Baltobacteraceae bacterium]|nr:YggS family pyridoxal phosphate-dependent enzyme [Candidatus Baltobacteraceae bacterium]